ncbi:MAG: 16S rRNA (uracil(1498)-N(3))-methyltransferase [Myxococcales bacterium]|nr:16S rRNA (uracil(1498)-N(3))-methyltransferase [Myxococcales bacterium]
MNLLLLRPEEIAPDGTARLTGRRLLHAREVLRASAGDELRAGVLGGPQGSAEVLALSTTELVLRATFSEPPPPRPGVSLLLAIPRPKALRKVLPAVASLGVDRLVLINANRVEKSYFDSRVMASIEELLLLGLEQARDTIPPEVIVRERFRPYVEDELDSMFPDPVRLLAHPAAAAQTPPAAGRAVLAIGPEGGWVPFEIALLEQHGFTPFTLGPRTLRVEVAVPYVLGAISRSRINP